VQSQNEAMNQLRTVAIRVLTIAGHVTFLILEPTWRRGAGT
jgi:hypothetical protein